MRCGVLPSMVLDLAGKILWLWVAPFANIEVQSSNENVKYGGLP